MGSTTRIFHLRPTHLLIAPAHTHSPTPASVHFFSSSSPSPPDSNSNSTTEPPPQPLSQSALSAFLSDVKVTVQQSQQQRRPQSQQSPPNNFSFFPSRPNQPTRLRDKATEEIRRNLSEYRRRTVPPPPTSQPNAFGPAPANLSEPISFAKIYNRITDVSRGQGPTPDEPGSRNSLEGVRQSLRNMKVTQKPDDKNFRWNEPISPSPSYSRTSSKLFPTNQFTKPSSTVIGGSGTLPELFAREIRSKEDGDGSAEQMSWEFVKMYSPEELGEKLRLLRPEKKAGNKDWFSLEELNQRLVKLREMEENEIASKRHLGHSFLDIRGSLVKLKNDDTTKQSPKFRLDALTTPGYMLSPPKEDLVEKYFHPDNMSASEKLKLELNKVRDEFKMSESDCGSARVQVAQLTTKIKHLSEVLHPKDKHSRKGLQAMVERRKKLLKYMRRTDWGSYCFVLSKFGLRDNPGYKL